jgi:uncharacterized protein YebE (UPF0316 family)
MSDALQHLGTFSLIAIPLLVFVARILDVTIGTLRIIFVSRGMKYLAALLGFCESLVWILAIGQVIQNLNSWATYGAFALGFATGNFVGVFVEEWIALGNLVVRIITRRDASALIAHLRNTGYGVTVVNGQGETGQVQIIFTVCRRRDLSRVISAVKRFNPRAFYTVEDVRFVHSDLLTLPRRSG